MKIMTMILKVLKMSHCLISPGTDQGFQKGKPRIAVNDSQNFQYFLILGAIPGKTQHLVDHGQCVTHPSYRLPGYDLQCPAGNTQLFRNSNFFQKISHLLERDPDEIITLATGNDGLWKFVRIGRGQDELNMGRRFLERLQQGIEGLQCEHVRFIDDVDLITALGRGILDIIPQFTDVLDAAVRSSIDFIDIRGGIFCDLDAVPTFSTGIPIFRSKAVQGFCQDSGCTGFSYTS